jgi:prevent-host-death family protein
MYKTNALELRRALGKVLQRLERDGAPILIEKARRPTAVLISLRDYQERFADAAAAGERERLAEEILALKRRARPSRRRSVDILRELRGPLA